MRSSIDTYSQYSELHSQADILSNNEGTVDYLEHMSMLQPDDMGEEDLKNFSSINKKARNEVDFNDMSIKKAEPIERYMYQVKKALNKYKTGLAD